MKKRQSFGRNGEGDADLLVIVIKLNRERSHGGAADPTKHAKGTKRYLIPALYKPTRKDNKNYQGKFLFDLESHEEADPAKARRTLRNIFTLAFKYHTLGKKINHQ